MNRKNTLLLTALLVFVTSLSFGQRSYYKQRSVYRGIEGVVGVQRANIKSNIPQLNDLNWIAEGGRISAFAGNARFSSRLGLGLFYASGAVPQTVDLVSLDGGTNFYFLNLISQEDHRVNPYLGLGLSYNIFKFAGMYLNDDPASQNYSIARDNYIGKVKQANALLGLGVDYRMNTRYQFFSLFVEGNYGLPLSSTPSINAFKETSIGNLLNLQAGFRIGMMGSR